MVYLFLCSCAEIQAKSRVKICFSTDVSNIRPRLHFHTIHSDSFSTAAAFSTDSSVEIYLVVHLFFYVFFFRLIFGDNFFKKQTNFFLVLASCICDKSLREGFIFAKIRENYRIYNMTTTIYLWYFTCSWQMLPTFQVLPRVSPCVPRNGLYD